MKLPTTFKIGEKFRVRSGKAGGDAGALGHYEHEKREIVIDSSVSDPIGQAMILIHEMMHAAECGMIDRRRIKRHINHEFIHAASFGAAIALARCGALEGVTDADVTKWLKGRGR